MHEAVTVAGLATLRVRPAVVALEVLVARLVLRVRDARTPGCDAAYLRCKRPCEGLKKEMDVQVPQSSKQPKRPCFQSRLPDASRGIPASSDMAAIGAGCCMTGGVFAYVGVGCGYGCCCGYPC